MQKRLPKPAKQRIITAAHFSLLTPFYDGLSNFLGFGKRYRELLLSKLAIRKNAVVLDAGCGTGSMAVEIKRLHPKAMIFAVDADPKILRIAKKKAKKANATIAFTHAYLQQLPFKDNTFDAVYSSLVIHHLKTKDKLHAFIEIRRVLKKSGTFLLSDFGKPKGFSLFPYFATLLEEGNDNIKDRIPTMLKRAEFRKVKNAGRYRNGVQLLKVVK